MSTAPSEAPRHPLGMAWRLFTAMGLVVIAGAGTMLVAALLVAQPVFRSHLDLVRPPVSTQARHHVDEAFASALLISLSVGVVFALVAALVVTWLVAKRIAAPVGEAGEAAQRIADGDYETRLPQPRLGPEFDRLTDSFNTMARQLATTEQTRRRLLTDLAHELRTPLASIEATIEAVTDGILPNDQTTLATLTEQSKRLHRLVGDLSAVSRAEERRLNLHPVLVPLENVVSGAVAAARPRFDAKGISLTVDGGGTPWQVLADPDRLAEALGALLDNALRHTATGGTVIIATTRHDDRCRIAVSDTGEGFDPAIAARLFERFYPGRLLTHRERGRERHRADHRQGDRHRPPRTAARPQRRARPRRTVRGHAADRRPQPLASGRAVQPAGADAAIAGSLRRRAAPADATGRCRAAPGSEGRGWPAAAGHGQRSPAGRPLRPGDR